MAFQPGDVINIARVAWDVYNYGWTSELRASTQYAAFGAELRHLSQNLNVLASVVHKAQESLKSHGVRDTSQIRWDPASLVDIVGDFKTTIRECQQLLKDNERYGNGSDNPIRSIEWNVLVQPTVDRLRPRIQMHSARMQTVLKPFEIDLLTRIHEDLAQRIGAVHNDVRQVHSDLRSLIGVLVPDLKTALDQQDALQIRLLPVPPDVQRELEAVFRLHPVWMDGQFPPLRDMADAFITSLDKSTRNFKPGLTVNERIPSRSQYLNLLKCLFLMRKMQESEELEAARAPPTQSHWPSYVKELEEKLSHECDQFSRGMIAPSITPDDLDADTLGFWVEEEPGDLIDTVTTKVMMEELMEIPLFSNSRNVSKRLRLMRHTGTHDKRYRLVISATERITNNRSRQQREVVDFDVTTAKLNPVYALSGTTPGGSFEMILEANNKIHRLGFCTLDDVFLFQQAVTGFKVVDNYFEDRVKASFVIEGQGGSILEDASIQLWIQRRLGGSLVTDTSDSPSSIETPPSPIPISAAPRTMSPTFSYDDFGSPQFDNADSIAADFGHMTLSSSPGKMSMRPDPLSRSPLTPPSATVAHFPASPPRSQTLATSNALGKSPSQDSTRSSSIFSKFKKKKETTPPSNRTYSVSSNTTTATSASAQSTSSSASDTTVTVHGTGAPKTAVIHNMPLKPMLVLFTHDAKTGRRAVVVLSVDEKTTPNPQRCWCQQAASPDGGPCKITALEQQEGAKPLEARRLHCQTGQWDLLPLSVVRRKEARGFGGAEWRGLNRMSILFPHADARFRFGGGFCLCRPQTEGDVLECIKKGHVGLLGQVRVHYRNQSKRWYNSRYGAAVHVSHLSLTGGPGDLFWKGP